MCARVSKRQDYFKLVPFVSKKNFPDLSFTQILILQRAQTLTADLEDEKEFNGNISRIIELLGRLIDEEREKE